MTPESDTGNSWDRVAAELRACREAQQRAWGDIDNTTLGRFLAGEVTAEEQQQIENALNTLPELRKLTDLVREVLAEPETSVPISASELYGPAAVPFPEPQSQARTIIPSGGWKTPGPSHGRKRWFRDPRFQQRVGLALAACLLLFLGVALPRTKTAAAPEAGESLAFSQPVAERGLPFGADRANLTLIEAGAGVFASRNGGVTGQLMARENNLLARVDASVHALEAEGKKQEAEMLARQYVNNLTRQALVYQEKGDLDRAEPALNQARLLCTRTLGAEATETVRMRNSLAGVYEVALNTAPASSYLDALARKQDMPQLMAKTLTPPPAPIGSADAATASPVRSESAYAAPATPPGVSTTPPPAPRHAQKPTHTRHALPHAHLPPGGQAACALYLRITRQSQKQVKTSVVPVLTQALRETKDAAERQRLARALGRLGPAAADAVPVLLDAYREASVPSERAAFLVALGQIGSVARQAVPLLVDSLHDNDQEVRKSAARALVLLGSGARGYRNELANRPDAGPLLNEVLQRLDSPEGRSGIDDAAECFSVEALQQGREAIVRLTKQARIEVHIETVRDEETMKKRTAADQHEARRDGVYLCINKDAPAVQIFISEALRKRGLTDQELRRVLEPSLRRRDFDSGLASSIRYLADFETKQARK